MRRHLRSSKKVNATTPHDIKLELDVRCQAVIERGLHAAFPEIAVLGEEGTSGCEDAVWRWVVDPIDGTVNFACGIPHAAVSIALQRRIGPGERPSSAARFGDYCTVVGVVYDPFLDELWTAVVNKPARLNGRVVSVSSRRRLSDAIITVGFAKHEDSLERMLPVFSRLLHRVLKLRIMGTAALGLTYIATGRFDGYVESGLRLWDIAAGALIIPCAGGRCDCPPVVGEERYALLASNGHLHRALRPLAKR
jgi:myo-inositol-1(or 4)-monophosphatase